LIACFIHDSFFAIENRNQCGNALEAICISIFRPMVIRERQAARLRGAASDGPEASPALETTARRVRRPSPSRVSQTAPNAVMFAQAPPFIHPSI
jgi:hypothetical protein